MAAQRHSRAENRHITAAVHIVSLAVLVNQCPTVPWKQTDMHLKTFETWNIEPSATSGASCGGPTAVDRKEPLSVPDAKAPDWGKAFHFGATQCWQGRQVRSLPGLLLVTPTCPLLLLILLLHLFPSPLPSLFFSPIFNSHSFQQQHRLSALLLFQLHRL